MRGFGTLYRQKNSRFWWIEYWQHGKRRRESTGCEQLAAARDVLKRAVGQLASSIFPHKVRLAELYEAIERDYQINRRKSIDDLKARWSRHLKSHFATLEAARVHPDQIACYIADRQREGVRNSTINRELAVLKRMYGLAIAAGKLSTKPHIPMLKERNVRKGFVRDADYHRLAESTGKIGLWLRAMFEIAYSYGWRKTELLEMRVGQVDLTERTLTLDPGATKNEQARVVEMTNTVYELVRRAVEGKRPEEYLFTRDRDGRGRRPRRARIVDFRRDWEKATKAAECEGLLFHDLRRSGVRNLVRAGVSEKVAMTITGHKTRSVFERYNIVNQADVREAVKRLDRAARDRRQAGLFEQGEMFREEPARKPAQPEVGHQVEAKRLLN